MAALTTRRLASELGIRAPSSYKHVQSKEDIVLALHVRALRGQADALSDCRDLSTVLPLTVPGRRAIRGCTS